MKPDLLILRPRPGAAETAARAEAMGMAAVTAPLFTIHALEWDAEAPSAYDALLITSANAVQHGGAALALYADLPCYAVGEGSATAARDAGLAVVRVGPRDGRAIVALMAKDGIARALHLCGRDHIPLHHPEFRIERRIVYAAEAVDRLPAEAIEAVRAGALVLLHSPRAASLFAALTDAAGLLRGAISLATISEAVTKAAGGSWKAAETASAPRDHALLELAAKLCKTDSGVHGK